MFYCLPRKTNILLNYVTLGRGTVMCKIHIVKTKWLTRLPGNSHIKKALELAQMIFTLF